MKFILVADKNQTLKDFFPFWQVAIFIAVITVILILLVPSNMVEKALDAEHTPARLIYLQAYSSKEPENTNLQIMVIEQEIEFGLIPTARAAIEKLKASHPKLDTVNEIKWLNYLIIRYYAYNLKPNTAKRLSYLSELSKLAAKMEGPPLSTSQLKIVAMDHLDIGEASLALKIYNYLYNKKVLTSIKEFEDGASIAVMSNNQVDAAKFYQAAYLKSVNLVERKSYALAVVKAFWAANMPEKAVIFAKTLPKEVTDDRHMLAVLWQVSMAASHPEQAEEYAIRALLLNPKQKKSTTQVDWFNSFKRLEK